MTVLLDTEADWLAPHALVVGFLRVTTDDLTFRPIVPNPEKSLDFTIGRIKQVRFEAPAVVITLDDEKVHRFILADGATAARAIDQACVAREKKNIYR